MILGLRKKVWTLKRVILVAKTSADWSTCSGLQQQGLRRSRLTVTQGRGSEADPPGQRQLKAGRSGSAEGACGGARGVGPYLECSVLHHGNISPSMPHLQDFMQSMDLKWVKVYTENNGTHQCRCNIVFEEKRKLMIISQQDAATGPNLFVMWQAAHSAE